MRAILVAGLMVAVGLAGCTSSDSGPTGHVMVSFVDDVPSPVQIVAGGAWGLTAGDVGVAEWYRVVEGNQTWELIGSGQPVALEGPAPVGDYQGIRVTFTTIEQGGVAAILSESGFDLPVEFSVVEGQETAIEVGMAWTDALFDSVDGLAFRPALDSVRVVQNGIETLKLEAQDIEIGGTKPPVARMRIFDSTGLQVMETDFIAESLTSPVVGNPGNLTFAAASSEVLQPGAEIEKYEWDMGDGTILDGITVEHYFAPGTQNRTVRLTVTDSAGGTDSISSVVTIKDEHRVTLPISGSITGLTRVSNTGVNTLNSCDYMGNGEHPVPLGPVTDLTGEEIATVGSIAVSAALTQGGGYPFPPRAYVTLYDDAGEEAERSGRSTAPSVLYEFDLFDPEAQPAGDYSVTIDPCEVISGSYDGEIVVTYVKDPVYYNWVLNYDDGHDHQH